MEAAGLILCGFGLAVVCGLLFVRHYIKDQFRGFTSKVDRNRKS